MSKQLLIKLSRRERQIMEAIYRQGESSVGDIRAAIDDPPSYSAVRATVAILENKGHLTHRRDGQRYLYRPTAEPAMAAESALSRVVSTFFGGSPKGAVAALLDQEELSPGELDEIERLIAAKRRESP